MTRLLLLSLVLVGSFAVFLVRGVPQTARLERAWGALRQRESAIEATRAELDLPGPAEYQALVARHARAQAQLEQRWAILTEGPPRAAAPALADVLERSSAAGLRWSKFIYTMTSEPPAIGTASGREALSSNATASLSVRRKNI